MMQESLIICKLLKGVDLLKGVNLLMDVNVLFVLENLHVCLQAGQDIVVCSFCVMSQYI